jgi:hypothetical protein
VLRGFALEVRQLVHAAPLDRRPRPHEADATDCKARSIFSDSALGDIGVDCDVDGAAPK